MEEGGKSRLELGSQEGVMDGKGKGESNRAFSVRRESQLFYSGTGMCSLSYPAVQGLVSRHLCLGKACIYLQERGQMSTAFPHVL